MRILVASSYAPLKAGHGNELQVFHVVDQLAREHEVSVVYYGTEADVTGAVSRAVPPVPWRPVDRATTFARNFVGGTPALVRQLDVAGFGPAVAQEARRFRPDVLYATSTHAAGVIDQVPGVPRVLNVIDAWAHLEREMSPAVTGWRLWAQRKKLAQIYAYEQSQLDRFAAVVTVSESDRRFMQDMGAKVPIHVVSNGVDTEFFTTRPEDRPWPEYPVLTFHGIMSFVPNEGAAVRLAERVMPKVWRTHPDVRVQFVGRHPTPQVLKLAGDRVEVTGAVDDIRPYLWDATVCVFPIFAGSGVKNKLLEASSMAKAMVATPSAVGDLKLHDDRQALVRDDDAGLARAIVELLDDPARRDRLGAAARDVVQERHSWAEVGRRIGRICAEAVEAGPPR